MPNQDSIPTAPAATAKAKGQSDGCPVDHSARAAWTAAQAQTQQSKVLGNGSCDSSQIDRSQSLKKLINSGASFSSLSDQREISSIPRGSSLVGSSESPKNEAPSKNWIYPSEQMFFNAMRRKNWDPKAEDMQMIVPIHNAVNEKAWQEIVNWEKGRGSEKCGGPKLLSFSGDSQKMTPKARMLSLLGYQAPFDRHDWVVDRCGQRIEYVIDFYSGKKQDPNQQSISFYLDVRPKLSFEGIKMRTQRWLGW